MNESWGKQKSQRANALLEYVSQEIQRVNARLEYVSPESQIAIYIHLF